MYRRSPFVCLGLTRLNTAELPVPPQGWNWINQLADTGWVVARTVVSPELSRALRVEAETLHSEAMLERAGIGRAGDHTIKSDIRRDKTRWLSRDEEVQARYLDVMEQVRLAVNEAFYLGLFSYEAHFAVYEPGAFYKRHMDSFKGARNRVLSTVFYLNEDWDETDGGALAIFDRAEAEEAVELVLPELGTLVIFLSEDIPHEVLPAMRDRYSIAGWFRVNDRAVAPSLQTVQPTTPEVSEF